MDSSRSQWTKGPVCGIENCRSRLYEEGEDGYQYCQNGHRRGDTLVAGEDDDDFNPLARRQRAKVTDDEPEKACQYFKGAQAFDLYLKSIQLVLRHQLWFLVKSKGLPQELENIVCELWALRILQLESRTADISDDIQSQGFTTSESENETENEGRRKASPGRRLSATPTLLDNLALCYLGMHTLRLPVTPGDIHAWITNGDMPYFRAIKLVPPAMRDRLPANYHASLDPNGVVKLERFHYTIGELVIAYSKEYGSIFPPLNHPLLLFRYLKGLALPLEVYGATIKLAEYLECDFSMSTERKGRMSIRDIPEARLISLLVVCVKLFYPFDDRRRYPKTLSEPAATVLNWSEWSKHIDASKDSAGSLYKVAAEDLMKVKEKDVFTMNENILDQYLDWYQRTWIDERAGGQSKDSDFQIALQDMFPIDTAANTQQSSSYTDINKDGGVAELETLKAVHTSLKPRTARTRCEDEEPPLRPGNNYKHYRKPEDLPNMARRFYEEAARISGLSLSMLTMAVFFMERRVQKWSVEQRKLQASSTKNFMVKE
ncbi:hypothetical protein GQ43DRAFT_465882 [Delitschia confertaspora ATCC 74209]|uniref:RRN7-type domain-containing protein n=1 Tax=Delitschia confertaspora ATCC 74209 TaxID=1513339 RepID=A0A9P4MSJ9_9PLEO|nr:hypothetical protein GQ43DRAFT_465882 [Delitschia confertaspora ATCC 74209]